MKTGDFLIATINVKGAERRKRFSCGTGDTIKYVVAIIDPRYSGRLSFAVRK